MYKAYKTSNVIACVYWIVFIFLVVGQSIHISYQLSFSEQVLYLYNLIGREGHSIASSFVLLIVILVAILEHKFSTNFSFEEMTKTIYEPKPIDSNISGRFVFYFLNWAIIVSLFVFVVKLVGGFDAWITQSRPTASGSTFFIIGIGSGIYPLLIKRASNIKLKFNDILLSITSLLMIVSFSRILAIFHIFLIIIVIIYSNILYGRILSFEKYISKFILSGILILFIMFGYGSYRHVAPQINNTNPVDVYNFIIKNPESSLFSLDLNYRISVEGMTGLSAVITQVIDTGVLKADFGISLLGVFFRLIPSFFRKYFGELPSDIESFYWYPNSIVGGGLEGVFVHFSFLGLLIYPFLFYHLAYGTHKRLISYKFQIHERNDVVKKILNMSIIAVYGLHIIRGSTIVLFFFMISELVVMNLALSLFKTFLNQSKLKN